VAPGGIILHTADAEVISQITARGDDFPKATHLYKHVDIYGKNVVSSGGAIWRRHRAVTSPAFTEKNNRLVWKETLDITQTMLASWVGNSKSIRELASDSMRLSLEVIGRAGLGQKLDWSTAGEGATQHKIPHGHTMTFTAAVQYLLANMLWVMALPMWVLQKYPSQKLNKAYNAYVEWGLYMKEMIAAKKAAIRSGASESSTIDLIGQLIKGQEAGKISKSPAAVDFDDSDVMGNLFMFIIAGHETSANSIHFTLALLALHPQVRRSVQKELESIFQGRPISEWDYEHDLPRLLNGYLAAVLNEELRLIAPTITIPKISSPEPQELIVNGKSVTVPGSTMTRLCIHAVHCNPKYWPHNSPKNNSQSAFAFVSPHNDLEEFKPERWLHGKHGLYTPVKGSYIPFSDGQRACLGKRFAQVEILAALAVIFSEYSVELAVDEWATDEEVKKMTPEAKTRLWSMAEKKGHWMLQNKMVCMITLQLKGGCVPVRFVKKGSEIFPDI
jgi:cytochrome P450